MVILRSARSYGAGLSRHQWDAGTPLRQALPLLLAFTAAIATGAAVLGDAALADINRDEMDVPTRGAALPDRPLPPLLLRDLAPRDALAINRAVPITPGPNPAATPFRFNGDAQTYLRALTCLAAAIYYEAGNQTAAGKRAVAQVVLNRVRHPAFAKGVCGVVYEGSTRPTGCQFTFTCDGSLARRPSTAGWRQSLAVAKAALNGSVYSPVGYATHYHANYVVPYWGPSLSKNAVIGAHIFYRWPESWGRPAAFYRFYRGLEQDPALLGREALRASALDEYRTVTLTPEIDSRIELVSIVDFLARSSEGAVPEPGYRHQVHSYFSGHSNHLAVQLYRQMANGEGRLTLPQLARIAMHHSAPPELGSQDRLPAELTRAAGGREALAGLIAALRDFAVHTDFQRFWNEQRPIYVDFARQIEVDVQVPPNARTPHIVQAPLMTGTLVAECGRPGESTSSAWLVVASDSFTGDGFLTAYEATSACGVPKGRRITRSARSESTPSAL